MSAHGVEVGLLILRVVTGLAWCGHGTQKLFGWFGAKARGTLEDEFAHFGYHPPLLFGRVAGVTELVAGLLLATGFATPVGAGLLAAVSVQAIAAVKWPNGPWVQDDGYEYLLVLAAIAWTDTAASRPAPTGVANPVASSSPAASSVTPARRPKSSGGWYPKCANSSSSVPRALAPNQPKSFCAPWPHHRSPVTRRRISRPTSTP